MRAEVRVDPRSQAGGAAAAPATSDGTPAGAEASGVHHRGAARRAEPGEIAELLDTLPAGRAPTRGAASTTTMTRRPLRGPGRAGSGPRGQAPPRASDPPRQTARRQPPVSLENPLRPRPPLRHGSAPGFPCGGPPLCLPTGPDAGASGPVSRTASPPAGEKEDPPCTAPSSSRPRSPPSPSPPGMTRYRRSRPRPLLDLRRVVLAADRPPVHPLAGPDDRGRAYRLAGRRR